MPSAIPLTIHDPLHAFTAGAFIRGTKTVLPLSGTSFNVEILSGVAIVTTKRTFKNAEQTSIEATLTFPIPVHATLFDLTASIDGRQLTGVAKARKSARETYEDAIDRGKTSVLHEEVLRGVHMLSVGPLASGKVVDVTSVWVAALTHVNGRASLRIPLTVGEIYGRSQLPDADDFATGGPFQTGTLTIMADGSSLRVRGRELGDEAIQIPLNAPIDIEVDDWTPADLQGIAADGRRVAVRTKPAPFAEASLSAVILVDRSGSMAEPCAIESTLSKHDALIAGLHHAAQTLRRGDIIGLWEFSNRANPVGTIDSARQEISSEALREQFATLIDRLSQPSGGTEIGEALETLAKAASETDILLISDGKSHNLDVHAIARKGLRVQVVLAGEDSLEANVGHLAALTGAEIFVAAGAELEDVIATGLRGLRRPHKPRTPLKDMPGRIEADRAGLRLSARWEEAPNSTPFASASVRERAIGALAASLLLPLLPETIAASLAEKHNLVTHLTSLVLVDDDGRQVDELPTARKLRLPSPRMAAPSQAMFALSACSEYASYSRLKKRPGEVLGAKRLGRLIPWNSFPNEIKEGRLDCLPGVVADAVRKAAGEAKVIALAARFGLDPAILVIALIAYKVAASDKAAARVFRAIVRDEIRPEFELAAGLIDEVL
jgi:hypothetical protein